MSEICYLLSVEINTPDYGCLEDSGDYEHSRQPTKEGKDAPFGIASPRSHQLRLRSEEINRIQSVLARTHKISETTSRIDRSVQQ
jgi:hypothetical protein